MIERSVAVVSGKGGAGKTMLAMAITHELAIQSRTLIVDLDVFNRGLSGLLRQGRKIADVPMPDFLACAEGECDSPGEWSLIDAAPNVVTLRYPDITRWQRQRIESLSIAELSEKLDQYIGQLVALSGCHNVLLDCHGGPDLLSFAAVALCKYTILVSEPDRITFYGTLHFLRRMAEDSPTVHPDIRLVFNKVMPAFSERYLRRFYDANVKDLFHSNDLLAIIPFEGYLSKEFERFPFVTQVYPFSQLAGKARTIVRDLHLLTGPGELSEAGKAAGWLAKIVGLGVTLVPRFMNLDATTSFTAPALVAMVIVALLASGTAWADKINIYLAVVAVLISVWFVEVMLVNWLNVLDRTFTKQIRLRKFASTVSVFILEEGVGLFLASVPAGGVIYIVLSVQGAGGISFAKAVSRLAPSLGPAGLATIAICIYVAIAVWVLYTLIIRSIIAIWHEHRYFEGILRVLGWTSGIVGAVELIFAARQGGFLSNLLN